MYNRHMAILTPSYCANLRHDGGLQRELDVLERLTEGLPDAFEIFHEVTWHSIMNGEDRHGEIDIVVLSPNGNLLLVEVKAGDVLLRKGEMLKLYGKREKNVGKQSRMQYGAMVHRLKQAGLTPEVKHCVVLPDYLVPAGDVISIPRERIIDASEYDQLATRILALLAQCKRSHELLPVRQFLCNEFKVSPVISALRDQLKVVTQRLSEGLAVWVPRISHPSRLLCIRSTAGSGKTQLALHLLEGSVVESKRALYVCYDRPLADNIRQISPAKADVLSYYEVVMDHYRDHYAEPDFNNPELYQIAVDHYFNDSQHFTAQYDVLVIDEGQDFEPYWVQSLLPLLKTEGQLYLLEDDAQRLYEREPFELPDAITIQCNDNYRSPRVICQIINTLGLATASITSKSAYHGEFPQFVSYCSEKQLFNRTAEAIAELLEQGFMPEDIVVITGYSFHDSLLLQADKIQQFTTRRFTGSYTEDGVPIWTEGQIKVESVYRFKGQSAPAVVFSEIDFEALDDQARRKLFVGMTRAQIALHMVMSHQAERCVMSLL